MNVPVRGRGRPRAAEPARISELALALMSERGYAATRMTEIAEAAGMSPATLFRYFPSKSAVLWHGMEDSAREFRDALRSRDAAEPLVDAVFGAYVDMLHSSRVSLAIIKARIAIVHQETTGNDAVWARYEQWERMVTEHVAHVRALPDDALEARVVGGMVWSALWTAISAWATGVEATPDGIVAAARKYVAVV